MTNSMKSIQLLGTFEATVQPEVRPATAPLQRLRHRQQNRLVRQRVRLGRVLEEVAESTVQHHHRRQQSRNHQDFGACLSRRRIHKSLTK